MYHLFRLIIHQNKFPSPVIMGAITLMFNNPASLAIPVSEYCKEKSSFRMRYGRLCGRIQEPLHDICYDFFFCMINRTRETHPATFVRRLK